MVGLYRTKSKVNLSLAHLESNARIVQTGHVFAGALGKLYVCLGE